MWRKILSSANANLLQQKLTFLHTPPLEAAECFSYDIGEWLQMIQ